MQIIVFRLQEKYYAIPSVKVEEILSQVKPTKVPQAPHWVEGLINLRGNAVTLINFHKLLDSSFEKEKLWYNNIIVFQEEDEKFGLAVDAVDSVITIDEEDIQKEGHFGDYVSGIYMQEGRIINVIRFDLLFSKNEG